MKYLYSTLLSILFLCSEPIQGHAQYYINAHLNTNYWAHTNLVGYGGGLGLEYHMKRTKIVFDFNYGFGSIDRISKFSNYNFDVPSTIYIGFNPWGVAERDINYRKPRSDYAKQKQCSLSLNYNLNNKEHKALHLGIGVYGAVVEHFFTFTNVNLFYVDTPVWRGEFNYIPFSNQQFLTLGIFTELSVDFVEGSNIFSPYLNIGYGPRYSSMATLGLRMSTQLRKK